MSRPKTQTPRGESRVLSARRQKAGTRCLPADGVICELPPDRDRYSDQPGPKMSGDSVAQCGNASIVVFIAVYSAAVISLKPSRRAPRRMGSSGTSWLAVRKFSCSPQVRGGAA